MFRARSSCDKSLRIIHEACPTWGQYRSCCYTQTAERGILSRSLEAAEVALATGAHQITIHLREDRRHIQDHDVPAVHDICKKLGLPMNLEMGCHEEMVGIAIEERPEWICLVPEKERSEPPKVDWMF